MFYQCASVDEIEIGWAKPTGEFSGFSVKT
jgi:hypothetical protein